MTTPALLAGVSTAPGRLDLELVVTNPGPEPIYIRAYPDTGRRSEVLAGRMYWLLDRDRAALHGLLHDPPVPPRPIRDPSGSLPLTTSRGGGRTALVGPRRRSGGGVESVLRPRRVPLGRTPGRPVGVGPRSGHRLVSRESDRVVDERPGHGHLVGARDVDRPPADNSRPSRAAPCPGSSRPIVRPGLTIAMLGVAPELRGLSASPQLGCDPRREATAIRAPLLADHVGRAQSPADHRPQTTAP